MSKQTFCLILDDVNKLKQSLKGKSREFFTGTTEYRMSELSKLLDQSSAKEVNKLFEKALATKKASALVKVFDQLTPKATKKKSEYNGLTKKVVELANNGNLNVDNILDDYVEMQLGGSITPEEASNIKALVDKMETSLKKGSDNKFDQYNIEYLKDRRALQDYMESITPSPQLAIATGTIGRGNLLLALKSFNTNIIGNTGLFGAEAIKRRIQTGQFGLFGGKFIKDYMKHAVNVYNKTGIDIIRVMEIEDTRSSLGEKDQISNQGKGFIRKAGRFYEDIVFKKMLGTPDMTFASFHFADAVARYAYKTAKQEAKLMKQDSKWRDERATNLMYASTQLNPDDVVAYGIREQAKAEALYGTLQNTNALTTSLVFIRDGIDKATGNFKLGSNIEPFVKTPANVVMASAQYSGIYLPFSVIKYLNNLYTKKATPAEMRATEANIIRSGLGLVFSYMLTAMLMGDDDQIDYIPDYASANAEQKKIVMNGNASYNSVRVGDKWVSLDYFGNFGTPVLAFVMATKNDSADTSDYALDWVSANWAQVTKLPIVSTLFDISSQYEKAKKYDKTGAEIASEYGKGLVEFAYNRSVPMIVSDIAKGIDEYQRRTDYTDVWSRIQANIPVLRENLPVKTNTFGEEIYGEGFISQIMFGARLKTYNDDPTFVEVKRLMENGQSVTFDNTAQTTEIKELINVVGGGDKFSTELQDHYDGIGKMMKENFKWAMSTKEYKNSTDTEKKEILNDARSQAIYSYSIELIRKGVIDNKRKKNFSKPKMNYPNNTQGVRVKSL